MRIWDCHCHLRGEESGQCVIEQMDAAGIEKVNLFSRYPGRGRGTDDPVTRAEVRETVDHVAAVQSADPARIHGLVFANPRAEGMVEEIERGIVELGLRGVKMIPDHWSPTDDLVQPIYAKMAELGKPIQFHAGILYGFGDSSRFCRPVLYEALVNHPGVRFSLAHIGWPWVDECIAVFGRFRAAAGYQTAKCQMWVDTCRGTPDGWREEALRKAVPFCGVERLMFGVDGTPASMAEQAPVHVRKDLDLLRNVLGLSQAQIEMYFYGACEAFWGG
ncbi:MAG: amidohydrolase [Armatimonadetes bacterium]|nr:amidohydrolase [Armatimonadota bacterium]